MGSEMCIRERDRTVCVCVCVCVRERERERWGEGSVYGSGGRERSKGNEQGIVLHYNTVYYGIAYRIIEQLKIIKVINI